MAEVPGFSPGSSSHISSYCLPRLSYPFSWLSIPSVFWWCQMLSLASRTLLQLTLVYLTTYLTSPLGYFTGIENLSCPNVNSCFIASFSVPQISLHLLCLRVFTHLPPPPGWSSLCYRYGWLFIFQVFVLVTPPQRGLFWPFNQTRFSPCYFLHFREFVSFIKVITICN